MKYQILSVLAVLALLSGPTAYAATADDAAATDKYYNLDDRITKMKSDLNLTDAQVKEIKPVMENYKDKIHEARQEKEDKLDKILTSDQKDKMKNYKEDREKSEKGWWQF
jgi:Spy/CpxP family protein refolding chaperone